MISETCQEIETLATRHARERDERYARRNKIRVIDELLDEFELLNLAEEAVVPYELRGRVRDLVVSEEHPLSMRPVAEVRVVDWMDALYDVQDTLMLSVEDDLD